MVHLSPAFVPAILKGIKVHPDNPFKFEFIMDMGESVGAVREPPLKDEATRLIKYFLASLTVPEKDLWVNLSPYEKDRIVPDAFGRTEMGRDLLAQDYMLKQITASLIYPEDEIGKKFWKRVYEEAAKKFGTTSAKGGSASGGNIPTINTFNKVWIVPEKAVVYENAKAGTAYVVESKLKVMLEEDYLALDVSSRAPQGRGDLLKNDKKIASSSSTSRNDTHSIASQIIREIVIPALTKEINSGKNFAQLRQVYNSLILATWYKKKIKDSILSQVYTDKNKVAGINILDPQQKQKIYEMYLQAFKKGAYNYIKEEQDPVTQQMIPRKYFSGGFALAIKSDEMVIKHDSAMIARMLATGLLALGVTLVVPSKANFTTHRVTISDVKASNPQAAVLSAFDRFLDNSYEFRADEFNQTVSPQALLDMLRKGPVFREDEFTTTTAAALVEAITHKGISVPAAKTPIERLNKLLQNKRLYLDNRLAIHPEESLRFFGYLKRGPMVPTAVVELNRLLIEANLSSLVPARPYHLNFNELYYFDYTGDPVAALNRLLKREYLHFEKGSTGLTPLGIVARNRLLIEWVYSTLTPKHLDSYRAIVSSPEFTQIGLSEPSALGPLMDRLKHGGFEKYEQRMRAVMLEQKMAVLLEAHPQLQQVFQQEFVSARFDIESMFLSLEYSSKADDPRIKELLVLMGGAYAQLPSMFLSSFLRNTAGEEMVMGILSELADDPGVPAQFKYRISEYRQGQYDAQTRIAMIYSLFFLGLITMTMVSGRMVVKWRYHIPVVGDLLLNHIINRIERKVAKNESIDDDLILLEKAPEQYDRHRVLKILATISNPSDATFHMVRQLLSPLIGGNVSDSEKIRLLGALDSNEAVSILEHLVFNYLVVRYQSSLSGLLLTLGDMKNPLAQSLLFRISQLKDTYDITRLNALKLWHGDKKEKLVVLQTMYPGYHSKQVFEEMAALNISEAAEVLGGYLDKDAMASLSTMIIPEAQEILGRIAKDTHVSDAQRLYAIRYWRADEQTIIDLISKIKSTHPHTLTLAVEQLARVDTPAAVAAIRTIFDDYWKDSEFDKQCEYILKAVAGMNAVGAEHLLLEMISQIVLHAGPGDTYRTFAFVDDLAIGQDILQQFPLIWRYRQLKDAGIYPLRSFFTAAYASISIGDLSLRAHGIRSGAMDINNDLDVALNYSNLILDVRNTTRQISFSEFENMVQQIRKGNGGARHYWTEIEQDEQIQIRGLVYEAYLMRQKILEIQQQAQDLGRPLIVVENLSYGAVALAPITQEQKSTGRKFIVGTDIPVISTKIGSTEAHGNEFVLRQDLFTDDQIKDLMNQQPIVVVVDGSTSVSDPQIKFAHIPDGFKGYRNYFMAVNLAATGEIRPESFYEDSNFVQRLRGDGDFKALVGKLEPFAAAIEDWQPYQFKFWYPGEKRLYLRVNKQKVADRVAQKLKVQEITGPSVIFIQSGLEKEAVPKRIREEYIQGEHMPIYFDDRDNYKRFNLIYKPGWGFVFSKQFVDFSREEFTRFLDFHGEKIQETSSRADVLAGREVDIIALDLDGTIASLGSKLDLPMLEALWRLIEQGKQIVILTDDSESNVDHRLADLIHAIHEGKRHQLTVFSNSATTGYTFRFDGSKVYFAEYNHRSVFGTSSEEAIRGVWAQSEVLQLLESAQFSLPSRLDLKVKDGESRSALIKRLRLVFDNKGIKVKVYKVGRTGIRVVTQHKEDALRDYLDMHQGSEERLLIMADSARTDQMDRELLIQFPRAVNVNLGTHSKTVLEGVKPVFQMRREYRGPQGALHILQLLGQRGHISETIEHMAIAANESRELQDAAMLNQNGGIDLSSDKALTVQNNGQGIQFHIDSAQLAQLQNTPGFYPNVISIEPLDSLPKFLGIT